ncbi:hypothetical protein NQ317_013223 [Molorchus minor]|uniref:Uncharacterized protein n=1 Tax=Molorchus minor TaxID=1323400 RepID=A0ABQ9JQD8_9CUCU|nr:hypothetical protein NQ317_013223 [Molorchus minor]
MLRTHSYIFGYILHLCLGITSLYSEVSGRPSNSQRTPSISFYLPTTSSKHMPLNLDYYMVSAFIKVLS